MVTDMASTVRDGISDAIRAYAAGRNYTAVHHQTGLFDTLEDVVVLFDLVPTDRPHKPQVTVFWSSRALVELTPEHLRTARSLVRDKAAPLLSFTHDGIGYRTIVSGGNANAGIDFIPRAPNGTKQRFELKSLQDLRPFLTIYELRQVVAKLSDHVFSSYGHDRLKLFDTMLLLLATKVYDEVTHPDDLYLPRLLKRPNAHLGEQFQSFCHLALASMQCAAFSAQPYLDADTLRTCLEMLVPYSLRLTIDIGTQAEVLATFYQDVVSSTFRGSLGAYFTPKPIADLASTLSEPTTADTILDMSCGSGTFLLSARAHIGISPIQGQDDGPRIFGADIQERMVLTTAMNAFLHGVYAPHMLHTDGLRIDPQQWHELDPHVPIEGFSLIVGNPPFAGFESDEYLPYSPSAVSNQRGAGARVNKVIPFIVKTVQLLRPGGRAALVIPTSVLNGEAAAFRDLRHWLSQQVDVTGVVGIPRDAFVHTDCGIEGALLFFRKKAAGQAPSKVFFKTVANVGYDRRGLTVPGSELATVADLWHRGDGADGCWIALDDLYQLDRWDSTWLEGRARGVTAHTEGAHVRLTALCSIVKRRFTQRSIDMQASYRYFEVGDADINTGVVTRTHLATGVGLLDKGRVRVPVQEGDVLLPNHRDSLIAKTAAQTGRSAVYVTARESGCITSNRFTVLKPLIHPKLLVFILNSEHVRRQLALHARGSASFDIRDKVLDEIWVSRRVLEDAEFQHKLLGAIEDREHLQQQLEEADSLLGLLMETLDT